MLGFQKWQGMFADSEIPIRMTNPRDIEIILKLKWKSEILTPQQLVEDDAVVNPLDPYFASAALIK